MFPGPAHLVALASAPCLGSLLLFLGTQHNFPGTQHNSNGWVELCQHPVCTCRCMLLLAYQTIWRRKKFCAADCAAAQACFLALVAPLSVRGSTVCLPVRSGVMPPGADRMLCLQAWCRFGLVNKGCGYTCVYSSLAWQCVYCSRSRAVQRCAGRGRLHIICT